MIGRFSILKSLDLEKISTNIEIYEAETGNTPYLFMSKKTITAIHEQVKGYLMEMYPNKMNEYVSISEMCAFYEGSKVFLNNDLEFGEVEIR